jgi:hypothetical protein
MRNVPTLFKETIMSSSFIAERQCDIEAPGGPGYTLNQSKIDSTRGDHNTRFAAARYVREFTESSWETFTQAWVLVYTG